MLGINVTQENHILSLEIDRPSAKNAINQDMYKALADTIEACQSNNSVRAILLHAQGGVFTSGNDMQDFLAISHGAQDNHAGRFIKALIRNKKPVVAVVEGAAIGIGTTLLQFCDFVFISPHAFFKTPFAQLGLCPEFASSQYLSRLIGIRKAKAMLMLGEIMTAEEALSLGFVTSLSYNPMEDANSCLDQLTLLPPSAMQISKSMLVDFEVNELIDTVDAENKQLFHLLTQPEAREAITAFLEKRPADFSQF
ncbi:enoyl-CoA hydratase-related protein [Photobacterium sanguinicancri]|uniref:Enoyl-CoA hydratase n=1 Tax=Photobacterium sanguinicancri TaxID=875932 RepID=A0AAW7XZK7_9GAMM|nr:enoyl-CoA hydratase-related protein [Photobacterium sanguinicancri]KXI23858.1 enoyl-CoA hydratase [Photobacterium sanguinicancri]MDO6541250.1 enoyl-CoA hydratase-related protein [Photobacterium sanguinicancri]OZS45227.1 enoyl-CoA hydratase [Photobacterium sanguinicancri]